MASVTLDTVSVSTGSPISQLIHRRANERAARDVTVCHPKPAGWRSLPPSPPASKIKSVNISMTAERKCSTASNALLHLVRLRCECGTDTLNLFDARANTEPAVGLVDNTTLCQECHCVLPDFLSGSDRSAPPQHADVSQTLPIRSLHVPATDLRPKQQTPTGCLPEVL